ncbi:hypothetical protein AMS68_004560 [Peltaster fructicola]|uniref:Uncharacterized protein n=1 Tax=Peltaster fructicola TaxID=286661 RepID=A0A6H0XWB3_9PEZI|nr:hypothetical protein AMS68_004560 [Peltaster fructicola]
MVDDMDHDYHAGWVDKLVKTPSTVKTYSRFHRGKLIERYSPIDHVLRGSRSFAARSLRSRHGLAGLRLPSDRTNNENASTDPNDQSINPPPRTDRIVLGEVQNSNQPARAVPARLRPSPTPSLKRKKAEAIVKAHGSPTHVRVTAGGRIVPSEQSPLCLPRYGYSAVQVNGGLIKFAPNYHAGKALQWGPTAQDGSQNGFVAQDIEGRLYQIVNGTILPLTEVDGGLQLYMPAPNLNITEKSFSGGNTALPHGHNIPTQAPLPPSQVPAPASLQPSISTQITGLELEYSKLDHELRDLDKTEVIHGKSMGRSAKDALVAKRRELVITLDGIRKAIKLLKDSPATQQSNERPQTPRAGSDRHRMSPRTFSNQSFALGNKQNSSVPASFHQQQFLGQTPFMPLQPSYNHESVPSDGPGFMAPPMLIPPMGFFMHPPPFDGSVAWMPPFQPYAAPALSTAASERPAEPVAVQIDGTSSLHELRPQTPRQSHALALKDPDTKQIINVKSLLNPMSPVYKPAVDGANRSARTSELDHKAIRDRPPTPLSFARLASTGDQTGDHSQRSTHHTATTSSGSSIRTMDFFPHNTRDHSMRKHEYPLSTNDSDKENEIPQDSARGSSDNSSVQQDGNADWNPKIPTRAFLHIQQEHVSTPVAPPGTPVASSTKRGHAHDKVFGHRHSHFLPSGEAPGAIPQAHHSHDGASSSHDANTPSGLRLIDFSHKPRAWVEGYQAGLSRRPVGADRKGDFLDGYCSGLLKSEPSAITDQVSLDSPGYDAKQFPVPVELYTRSKDCLKEAIYSPSNEDVILTPALDGPSIDNTAFNLGAWQKHHEYYMSLGGQGLAEFPFPTRSSSVAQTPYHGGTATQQSVAPERQSVSSGTHGDVRAQFADLNISDRVAFGAVDKDLPGTTSAPGMSASNDRPNMFNQGKRIISPLEWRTRNSLANVVNMTSHLFAQNQFDGQPADKLSSHSDREPMLASACEISGSTFNAEAGSRFKEFSLDGLSPPVSPGPMSPAVSPRSSPVKLSKTNRRSASRSTKHSPAKGKLEQIAGMVGIKISPERAVVSGEYGSPGKRHWKDLWKGSRSVSGKHEVL